jgi:putative heme-binding domain-containing protein
MRSLFEQAAQQIQSPETSVAARVNAIGLLAMGPPELALPVLPGLLDGRQPDAVQIAALRALNGLMSGSVAPAILDHWPALGPAARREAAEVLTARPERIAALLDAIGKGTLRAAEIDPLRRVQLTDHPDLAIRQRARDLLARSDRPERQPVIDAYAPALQKPADPTRGREVFLKHCATCHQAEGKGVTVGPDLATVTSRGDADLLVHILDPNREVAPIFVTYTVALDDGRVATGIIAEESASTIVLKRGEGVTENLPRARIEAVASTGQTLMPENLETLIDPPAMADLIRYLRQIKATPSAP